MFCLSSPPSFLLILIINIININISINIININIMNININIIINIININIIMRFLSTIGDDGSRQFPSGAASFVRVFEN